MYRPLSATRTRSCEIRPCLRILSASNSATRSAPVLAWRDGGNLCVCRAGRCGHRPLRLFIGNRCVGGRPPGRPEPDLRCSSCEAVIATPVTDVAGVAIRPPAPCLSSRVLSSYRITSISNPPCSARYVWGAGRIRFHRPTPCRPFSAARRNLA